LPTQPSHANVSPELAVLEFVPDPELADAVAPRPVNPERIKLLMFVMTEAFAEINFTVLDPPE
jgi:hypothetical protein